MQQNTHKSLSENIQNLITDKNKKGETIVIFITGATSTGKTTIAKALYTKYSFHQYISLGLVSKALRFFQDIGKENIEAGKVSKANEQINQFINQCINYYSDNGVNTIIEGIQCDTNFLSNNPKFTGGIILTGTLENRTNWSNKPSTHFKRIQDQKTLESTINYSTSKRFIEVENDFTGLTLEKVERALIDLLQRTTTD